MWRARPPVFHRAADGVAVTRPAPSRGLLVSHEAKFAGSAMTTATRRLNLLPWAAV